ncbi:MAG: LicD family protein [Clostridiales bacterium]|nr:LicD family protein [Clostridiales bacterium]
MNNQYDEATLKRVQKVQAKILKDVLELCERHSIDTFVLFGSAIGVVRHQGFIPWDDDIDIGMFREDFERFKEIAPKELGEKYELMNCETNEHFACTVNHFQKKDTTFISNDIKNAKYHSGITIDIFVFDHLADGKWQRIYQCIMTWFLGRLLFLSGDGVPFIPYKGIKHDIAFAICRLVHYGLKLFRITPRKIYKAFSKIARKYNDKETTLYATFETPTPWLNAMRKSDVYPLKKMPFDDFEVYIPKNTDWLLRRIFGDYMQIPPKEKRINHRPFKIEFGDDD